MTAAPRIAGRVWQTFIDLHPSVYGKQFRPKYIVHHQGLTPTHACQLFKQLSILSTLPLPYSLISDSVIL
jgi:hypothetical protein